MKAVEFEQVNYRYTGETSYVLRDLSLEIEKGSFVVVLGRNGSGKSTAAK